VLHIRPETIFGMDNARLAQILGMMGSAHDGEALAAARAAEKMRKAAGQTWEQMLAAAKGSNSTVKIVYRDRYVHAPPPKPQPQPRVNVDALTLIKQIDYLLDNIQQLSTKDKKFVRLLANEKLNSIYLESARQLARLYESLQRENREPEAPPESSPHQPSKARSDREQIRYALARLDWLNEWEQGFIKNVAEFRADNLSDKQLSTIKRIFDKLQDMEIYKGGRKTAA
jgi:hypothetical protein